MAPRIVFSPNILPKDFVDLAKRMAPTDFELVVADFPKPEFAEAVKTAEYFVGFVRGGLDDAFYKNAPKMKLIQLISAGYDRVDLDAARKAKVLVANNGGANAVSVAEHTMLLILSAMKKVAYLHENCMAGKWRVGDLDGNRLFELEGKTLGIVGLGNIGKKVARRAQAFGMSVIYYDIVRLTEEQEDALGVRFALFDEVMRKADVVSLHTPLSPLTQNMMNARAFGLMKPTAFFVNTCRGPVVDEEALFEVLATNKIMGAGLDVMAQEPPPADHKFFNLKNITITPHMAGPTVENWDRAFRNAFDNIQRLAAGRPASWVVPELRDLPNPNTTK
ncbi:MAG: 2-hydroxyacid dehydrogenase [Candidatus Rokubacteria bacterium]|nr:2-hydroxyacid dehydrogenase [Candidatus Rokubacteria bacterium]